MFGSVESQPLIEDDRELLPEFRCFTERIFPRYSYRRPIDFLRYLLERRIEWRRDGDKLALRMYGYGEIAGRSYGECSSLAQLVILDPDFSLWFGQEKKRGNFQVFAASGYYHKYFSKGFASHVWLEIVSDGGRVVIDPAFRQIVISDDSEYQTNFFKRFTVKPGQAILPEYAELEVPVWRCDDEGRIADDVMCAMAILGQTEDGRPVSAVMFVDGQAAGKLAFATGFVRLDGRSDVFGINWKTGEVQNLFGGRNPSLLEIDLSQRVEAEFRRAGISGQRPDTMVSRCR